MKTEKLIGLVVLGGAAWYFLSGRRALATAGGAAGWSPTLPGRVYDPTYYAGGEPSTAGSSGSGNMNPIATTLSTISNLLKGFTYRQTPASAPVSYGTPAAPGAPNGPSTKTGVSTGSGFLAVDMNRGSLVDNSNFGGLFDAEGFLIPSMNWTAQLTEAAPAAIYSQNVSASVPNIWY